MLRATVLSWLLLALWFPQPQSLSQGDEQRIIALENIWNQVQMKHDADAMATMLHPDFVFMDYAGTVMLKAAFLTSIRDPSNKLSLEVSDDMKLDRFGDTVVVTGALMRKARSRARRTSTTEDSRIPGSSRTGSGLCGQPVGADSRGTVKCLLRYNLAGMVSGPNACVARGGE